jgi:hypothetical protein
MMYAASHSDRYREMASAILAMVPLLTYPEAIADLRRLAARYERLAKYLDSPITRIPDRSSDPAK